MAQTTAAWRVHEHGAIEKLEPNLWTVEGAVPGMALRRVMTLVRMGDGRVLIHSAIALDDASMSEIEAWGEPSVLVIPNRFHRLDAAAYLERYPELEVYCPAGATKKVEELVPVDGDYDAFAGDASVDLDHLDGLAAGEGVLTVRSTSGTSVVLTDALFNMPHTGGLAGAIVRHVTKSSGGPRVSRLFRWMALKDAKAFRAHLERLASIPDLRRVIVAHHEPITERPSAILREVAGTLG